MPGPFCATCRREENKRLELAGKQEVLDKIRSDIAGWYPGKWAERVAEGPACTCGMKPQHLEANASGLAIPQKPIYVCLRHPGVTPRSHQKEND